LGLTAEDFVVRLSSRNAWHDFFVAAGGAAAGEYEFYQAVDKLEREAPEESEKKFSALGFSVAQVRAFINEGQPTAELANILKNLAARGMSDFVKVDYQVIRGLAYYTGVVFEAFDRKGEFRAIAGGGRYDNLVKLISGDKVDLPALGFGMGDVVLCELLRSRGLLPAFDTSLDVFCLIEDEGLRESSLRLIQGLRAGGLKTDYSLTAVKSDKQFKRALELKPRHTVKIEQDTTGNLTVRVKSLATRQEQILSLDETVSRLARRDNQ
jgi:histidyl-tRNA synthetase